MSLDPKDIRIGSWLINKYIWEPFEVLGLHGGSEILEFEFILVLSSDWHYLRNFLPIPLTEGVLKACRWEELEIEISPDDNDVVLDLSVLDPDGEGGYLHFANCNSLHLFQNAYRVRTGKELTINPAALREAVKNLRG